MTGGRSILCRQSAESDPFPTARIRVRLRQLSLFPLGKKSPVEENEDAGPPRRHARTGGTIRGRLTRTLALPLVVVLALLTVIAVGEVDKYRTAERTADAVTLDLAVQRLVQELQTERGITAGLLGGNAGFRAELTPSRQRVDQERARVQQLVAGGGEVEDRVADAVQQLDGIGGVRAGTDTGAATRAATFAFYTGMIAQLSAIDFGLDAVTDPGLRRGSATLAMLGAAKEATAQERAFLNGVFSAGGFGKGEFLQFVGMRSAREAALRAFDQDASTTALAAKGYLLDTGAAREALAFEQVALNAGDGRALQVDPQAWWSALTTVLDDMLQLGEHIGSAVQARAAVLRDDATTRLSVLAGAVLLCMAGSAYLAALTSRSVARPLAALAGEAHRLAESHLPDAVRKAAAGETDAAPPPVQVARGASIEVRLVADAFERVQATAFALATEQAQLRRTSAESLANLGRRNQNLLRRQLGFITELEREESTPAGLANLFELDHLATRMRRNAESLLVLVGAASPRQWSDPLPVSDVIRAAVSEVAEYRRVTLRRVDDATVAGAAASGVAHMLAELIENGLQFSPPDVDVEIHGRALGGGYLIAVSDQGIGMSPAELDRANERLRGQGDFITAPARFLGHYVVGRLGAELGVEVQLVPSPVTGVTARLSLPATLLAAPAVAAPARRVRVEQRPRRLPPAPAVVPPPAVPPPPAQPPVVRPTEERPLPAAAIEYVVVDGSSKDDAARTPNGLRKRTPRQRRAGAPTTTTGPITTTAPTTTAATATTAAGAAEEPTAVVDSPEAVRARLTAFRDGVRRGNTTVGVEGGTP